jgi:CRP-like cAMP-binding protein
VRGEAAVTAAGVEIARLGGGSIFGEMAVLDGGPRTATVTAITAMDLLVFTSGEFHALLREVPTVLRNVVTTMTSRLRLADRAMVTARQEATQRQPAPAN